MDMPRKPTRLVPAGIELRRDELLADWSPAVIGRPVFPIDIDPDSAYLDSVPLTQRATA